MQIELVWLTIYNITLSFYNIVMPATFCLHEPLPLKKRALLMGGVGLISTSALEDRCETKTTNHRAMAPFRSRAMSTNNATPASTGGNQLLMSSWMGGMYIIVEERERTWCNTLLNINKSALGREDNNNARRVGEGSVYGAPLICIRITVLFSSSCVENMLLPPAMPRDEV